jgi:putative transposase
MVRFIDEHRENYGVEPICEVLPIAPSTYHRHKFLEAKPEERSDRAKRDEALRGTIRQSWIENHEVYGVRKMWHELKPTDDPPARCTVERLMRQMGLQGVVRGKVKKTTIADDAAFRPEDLVTRKFTATRPNETLGG